MSFKFKSRLLAILLIIFLCIGGTIKTLPNDTFYIIKLGDFIMHHGIDLIDHYSWVANLSYTYPHWLYDLIMYVIYSDFDFLGIYISTIILFIMLILSIYIINLKVNKNELLAIILSVATIPGLIGFATARAQLVTAILFLWQVYFIERLNFTGQKKYIVFLSLISLLVANLHATIWPFYFILYLPFIGQHLAYRLISFRKNNKFCNDKLVITGIKHFKSLIVSFIFGLFMGFFSPSRICFTYIFKVMQGNSQQYIVEHAPTVVVEHPYFIIFILIGLLILIFSNTKIKLSELFMICGLSFMALMSGRHLTFFYIIGGLYLSILCNRYLIQKKDKTLDILFKFVIKYNIVYIGIIILFAFISFTNFSSNFAVDYIPSDYYPVNAVKYIKDNLDFDKIHLYNDYNFGSYLLFNDIPVFIDSRCDLYLSEFNGLKYSIFDDAMNIAYTYEEKFDFYEVTHILTSNSTTLYRVLSKDNDYTVIYEDSNFTLFKRV